MYKDLVALQKDVSVAKGVFTFSDAGEGGRGAGGGVVTNWLTVALFGEGV